MSLEIGDRDAQAGVHDVEVGGRDRAALEAEDRFHGGAVVVVASHQVRQAVDKKRVEYHLGRLAELLRSSGGVPIQRLQHPDYERRQSPGVGQDGVGHLFNGCEGGVAGRSAGQVGHGRSGRRSLGRNAEIPQDRTPGTPAGVAAGGQSTGDSVGVPAGRGQGRHLSVVVDQDLKIRGTGRAELIEGPALQLAGRDRMALFGQGFHQPDRLLGVPLHVGQATEGV